MGVPTVPSFFRPYRTVGLVLAILGFIIVFVVALLPHFDGRNLSILFGIVLVIIGLVLFFIKRPAPSPDVASQPKRLG